MRRAAFTLIVLIGLTCWGSTRAGNTSYDESVDGDLSGDRLAPTVVTLTPGSNLIAATSASGDLEYYTFTIPPNHRLSAVMVHSYTPGDALAFVAVQAGTTFTEPPTGTNVANLLGWTHFGTGSSTVGTDILDNMGTGSGAIGFVPPLSAGDYVIWSQQTGASTDYMLDFQVTAPPTVPALPGAFMVLLIAALSLAAFVIMRRRNLATPQA